MSIVFESGNCVYVSHEQYIADVYKNVRNSTHSFRLNGALFGVNVPFRTQTLKRKFEEVDEKFAGLQRDVSYVEDSYRRFRQELEAKKIFPGNQQRIEGEKKHVAENNSITDDITQDRKSETRLEEVKKTITLVKTDNFFALDLSRSLYKFTGMNRIGEACGENTKASAVLVEINGEDFLFPENCTFHNKPVSEINRLVSDFNFDVVVLDPPWWNKAVRRKRAKTNEGYQMMRNEELKKLPIGSLLNEGGLLVVWCTNSPQNEADLIDGLFAHWGVKFVAKWFWLKVARTGEPVVNFVAPPAKAPFERVIIATKLRKSERVTEKSNCDINCPTEILGQKDKYTDGQFGGVTNLGVGIKTISNLETSNGKIIVSIPSALHSHKPPLEEVLQPYLPKDAKSLEVFSRYLLPNYTSFGLETLRFQNTCLYETTTRT